MKELSDDDVTFETTSLKAGVKRVVMVVNDGELVEQLESETQPDPGFEQVSEITKRENSGYQIQKESPIPIFSDKRGTTMLRLRQSMQRRLLDKEAVLNEVPQLSEHQELEIDSQSANCFLYS